MSIELFYYIIWAWIALGLLIFPVLLKITAPYGRHTNTAWGPVIDSRTGWILMEIPALAVFTVFFLSGTVTYTMVMWVFFSFWLIHYVNRTFIFPFRLSTKEKKMPVAIVLMGICFNFVNGFINGYYLGFITEPYDISWFWDVRFIVGTLIFIIGFLINQVSDNTLIKLRKPGETDYKIPKGGLFKYISCPNLFGEIVEWTGFAIMVWSLPGLAFMIWTISNLLPRAIHHHIWYKKNFNSYPKERKAVIPFII